MTTPQSMTIEMLWQYIGQEVVLSGWLANRRSSGKIHFLLLRDGTGTVQAVMGRQDVSEDTFAAAEHLPQESSLILTGVVRADPRAPHGVEVTVRSIRVIQQADPYPITPK